MPSFSYQVDLISKDLLTPLWQDCGGIRRDRPTWLAGVKACKPVDGDLAVLNGKNEGKKRKKGREGRKEGKKKKGETWVLESVKSGFDPSPAAV